MNSVRTCIGCRQTGLRTELLRVISTGHTVEVDFSKSSHGRGAWLHRSSGCFKLATERKAFNRAFRHGGGFDFAGLEKFTEQAEAMLAPNE